MDESEIPDDIWEKARDLYPEPSTVAIAEALLAERLAERERCAALTQLWADNPNNSSIAQAILSAIATAIRKQP